MRACYAPAMANPEHLARILNGIRTWNEWKKEHWKIRVDLSRAHLADVDLEDADLHGANLSGAELTVEKIRTDAMQVYRAQLALRDNEILRLDTEKKYLESFVSERLIKAMLTATTPQNIFNASVYGRLRQRQSASRPSSDRERQCCAHCAAGE